ncbi:MAG: preprotein translocase subunit SecY [Niastella sp.]|nr:preprotein translocase subunit SecY [Niastella sp.]
MKKFITTLKNIWSIEELRSKIIYTLILLFVYRLGSFIVLPGIDPNKLDALHASTQGSGMLGLLDAFVGGAFSKASIFALGIMPYISASIFMQLVTILIPQMAKVQKEGESGRNKINQWTRYLTVIVTVFQAAAYIGYLKSPANAGALIPAYGAFFWVSTVILLTVGTLFVMWLGEKITDKGLGNGTSIIIMIGILARLPQAFMQEWSSRTADGGARGLLILLLEILFLIIVILGLILLVQGTRKVPVNYAKQIVGNRQFGGARNFLPLKVNASGVMPIIFAQAILFLPTFLTGFTNSGWARYFTDHTNWVYMLVYSGCVIAFTFLYTALIFNPKQMADELKRNNGFIPGVKPGKDTADYIGTIMDRITFPGAILLALVGILPGLVELAFVGMQYNFATFYGGTSLLIMVGVILDTLQQIETQLLMRQYDGLMSGGARLAGRAGIPSGM